MIPKIIHQIWIQGETNMPVDLRFESKRCASVNGDFNLHIWSEADIVPLLSSFGNHYVDLYHSYQHMAQKADLARYAILYVYGGIYLDTDMVCHKNLGDFIDTDFFLTAPNLHNLLRTVQNCIIGSISGHRLLEIMLTNCYERRDNIQDVKNSTGPALVWDSIEQYKKETGNDITIVDRKYMYPCHPYDDADCPYTCTDCYVAHMGNASWFPKEVQFFHKNLLRNYKYVGASIAVGIMYFLALRHK